MTMRVTWREQAPQKVRRAREDAGLTQEQLAELCGVTVNSVGHYEGGRAVPKVDTLERIADATGKPLAWFFGGDSAGQAAAPAPTSSAAPEPAPASTTTVDTGADLATTVAQVETEG